MSEDQLARRHFDLGPAGTLTTGEVFHRYPGKRALLHGELDGRPVVAKFYLQPLGQAWEWFRGVRGVRALHRAGVPSPALRHAGFCREAGAWLTVIDHLAADEPWPPSEAALEAANRRLVETLAHHHEVGIVQNDLNWQNFIPNDGVLHAIDGDRVRGYGRSLGRRRSLRHLGRLYAGKAKLPESWVRAGLAHYARVRGWTLSPATESAFVHRVQRDRRRHAERVARRACRGWKHYPRRRHAGVTTIHDRRRLASEQLPELLTATATVAPDADHGELTLDGRELQWLRLPHGQRPGPGRHRPALRIWRHALTASRIGLLMPQRVALILSDGGGDAPRAALFIQEPPRGTPLPEQLTGPGSGEALDALRRLMVTLHASRITLTAADPAAFVWDGERLILRDPRLIRCHSLTLPGFRHRWADFQQRLENELSALLPGARLDPAPDAG